MTQADAIPESHAFLQNLALILCVAGATTLLFRRLRQPVVFGYLLAGMIIGPHIPIPLVADEALVHTLAELGVILLMFALGLEFSLRKLIRVGPTAGVIAVVQTSAMVFLGYGVGQAFGWTTLESLFAGAVIAISSTTIIVKAFAEQKTTGRVAEVVFGVLIIEDLIAIFLLAVLTTLSTSGSVSGGDLARTGMRLAGFLAGLLAIGLLVVPRLMRATVRLESPETTVVTAVGISFATALLALVAGYSVALGAFIGGMLVAESGEAVRIEHLVAPVRDLFAAIFFVAVGMLFDPALVAEHWLAVLILTLVVVTGKVVFVSLGAFLVGYGTRTSVQTGMSLAQIGEFSFIIAGIGLATGATRPFLYPVAVAVSAITTLSTPWLIRSSAPLASFIDRKLPKPLQTFAAFYETWLERLRSKGEPGIRSQERRLVGLLVLDVALLMVLVVGTALELNRMTVNLARALGSGQDVARSIVTVTAALLATPLVVGFFRTAQRLGQVLAAEVLPSVAAGQVDLGAAPRRALSVTLQLAIVMSAGIPLLAITQPFLPPLRGPIVFAAVVAILAIAWWRSAADLSGHTRAGAQLIVAALAKQVARGGPAEGGHLDPAGDTAGTLQPLADVHRLLPGLGEPMALGIEATDYACGRTLASLDVRSRTGAVVLAITRAGDEILLPTGREKIHSGDVLALAGTGDAVRAAAALLRTGPESSE
ncbi:MAG TPA: cation:proton antiporter [Gemmatimonadales bacterium]|nr:cation:proton antiporter [Gemmatimonadales bacterium]